MKIKVYGDEDDRPITLCGVLLL